MISYVYDHAHPPLWLYPIMCVYVKVGVNHSNLRLAKDRMFSSEQSKMNELAVPPSGLKQMSVFRFTHTYSNPSQR